MARKPTLRELKQGGRDSQKRACARQGADDAVLASEERYGTLVENSLTGIYIDLDGKIVFANKKFAEIYRYPRAELIGMESWKLVHPEDRALTDQIRAKRIKGEDAPSQYPARGLTKDGQTIWVLRRNTRIDYEGKPAILGNLVDITESRRAEEALRESTRRLQVAYEQAITYAQELKVEITERNRAEKALRQRERQLRAQTRNLEEMNTALKVLLNQREQDRKELEKNVLANVKELVLPYVDMLRDARLDPSQKGYVSVIESNLEHIVSPFLRRLSSKYRSLTPKEIQIADFVKLGRTTKEIAALLNLSIGAIESHRRNIRAKLGLKNQSVNLRTHLSSFE
jgi:PAS domain S-box-containing protein